MESNNTNVPNFQEMDWQVRSISPRRLDPIKTNFNGFFDNQNLGQWNSMTKIEDKKFMQLLEVKPIPNGIEVIYKVVKSISLDLSPFDEFIKDVYLIENGTLVLSKSLAGKYVNPKPASYEFDE